MANIGVNITERESQGSSVLSTAPIYNLGAIVKSKKGVVGQSVLVTSLESYKSAFGGADDNNSYYAIKGIFENIGSADKPNIYVTREYDPLSSGTASSYQIDTGNDYIKISAGYYGEDSPGVDGNNIRIKMIQGSIAGNWRIDVYELRDGEVTFVESTPEFEIANIAADVNNFSKWIKVEVFGVIADVVVTADVAEFKNWSIAYPGNDLDVTLTSGAISNIEILRATTPFVSLGVTISVAGQSDLVVTLTKAQLLNLIDVSDLTDTGGSVYVLDKEKLVEIFNDVINAASTSTYPLVSSYYSGTNTIEVTSLYAGVNISTIVSSGGSTLTPSDLTAAITDPSAGYSLLKDGVNPGAPSLAQVFATIVPLLEGKNIQYVMSPERTDVAFATQLNIWCKNQGDVMGIFQGAVSLNPNSDYSEYSSLLVSHSYVAGYSNWGYVTDELNGAKRLIPTIGHIFGAYYVQRKNNFGGYAHIAPGGVDVSLLGLIGLQFVDEMTPELVTAITRNYGFNVVKFSPGYGYVIESSRTFSTKNKYYSIHIRTAKNFIIQSIRNQMKIYQQRPNNEVTRESLKNTVRIFLGKRYQEGMFETLGGFDNNVAVQCDEENNDLSTRKNRQLVLGMSMNFVEIAEEININLIQLDGGFSAEEV